MKIKQGREDVFKDWVEKNQDPYGKACVEYSVHWAELIESQMADGKKLEDVAKDLSHTADTEGITGFMYGMAVRLLAECWEHGEQLRRWHNVATQLCDEGELANIKGGVLNPAIVTIGGPERGEC